MMRSEVADGRPGRLAGVAGLVEQVIAAVNLDPK
jgi:hypothetical protein